MAKLTIEDVKAYCKSIGVICISDNYKTMKDDLKLICPNCKNIYSRTFDNIKQRKNPLCAKCGREAGSRKLAFTYDDVKDFIENSSESGCKLVSNSYSNADAHIQLQCKCGQYFTTTYYKFKQRNKRQCNSCGLELLKTSNATPLEVIKKMVSDSGYTLIGDKLPGGDQKILVRCDNGHTEYWVSVAKFKSGRRCPYCYRSLGEESISLELDRHRINYTLEYTFNDLLGVGGGLLRYDFMITTIKGRQCLIEYDGKQHFEVAFDDESTFIRTQKHDRMKNEYAKNNSIPLYRIPYTEYDNIPKIINKIINQ